MLKRTLILALAAAALTALALLCVLTLDGLSFWAGTRETLSMIEVDFDERDREWWLNEIGPLPTNPNKLDRPPSPIPGRASRTSWNPNDGVDGVAGGDVAAPSREAGPIAFEILTNGHFLSGRAIVAGNLCAYRLVGAFPFGVREAWKQVPCGENPGNPLEAPGWNARHIPGNLLTTTAVCFTFLTGPLVACYLLLRLFTRKNAGAPAQRDRCAPNNPTPLTDSAAASSADTASTP